MRGMALLKSGMLRQRRCVISRDEPLFRFGSAETGEEVGTVLNSTADC